MLVLLSPAKSMCSYRATQFVSTCPGLLEKTDTLLKVMKGKSKGDLKALMHISDAVASLNYDRYQSFITNEDSGAELAVAASNSETLPPDSPFKLTSLVFDGPAYRSFDADSFTAQQYEYAQTHVRILSGLYGVLRPWDLIQEYRLEMGSKLSVGPFKSLYDFWGDTVTDTLLSDLKSQHHPTQSEHKGIQHTDAPFDKKQRTKSSKKDAVHGTEKDVVAEVVEQGRVKVVVNLASQEYFKSVRTARLSLDPYVRVVECVFKDKGRVTSVYAKRARGLMARFIVTEGAAAAAGNRGGMKKEGDTDCSTSDPDSDSFQHCMTLLRRFDLEGYSFQEGQSSDKCIVFNRAGPPPVILGGEEEDEPVKSKSKPLTAAQKKKLILSDQKTEVKLKGENETENEVWSEAGRSSSTVATGKRKGAWVSTIEARNKEMKSEEVESEKVVGRGKGRGSTRIGGEAVDASYNIKNQEEEQLEAGSTKSRASGKKKGPSIGTDTLAAPALPLSVLHPVPFQADLPLKRTRVTRVL